MPGQQSLAELEFERGPWPLAQRGALERLTAMIAARPQAAEARDRAGYTPLHYAARCVPTAEGGLWWTVG
jgi:hypothetical protein